MHKQRLPEEDECTPETQQSGRRFRRIRPLKWGGGGGCHAIESGVGKGAGRRVGHAQDLSQRIRPLGDCMSVLQAPGPPGAGTNDLYKQGIMAQHGGMSTAGFCPVIPGLQCSGCNVRVGLWPRLPTTTFIARCPRCSHPAHSGDPAGGGGGVGDSPTSANRPTQTTKICFAKKKRFDKVAQSRRLMLGTQTFGL